jgi:sulfhydrogenase subunit beta (sulfur reductase)
MHGKLIHKNDLPSLIGFLRKEYRVFAPFAGKGRDSYFAEVDDSTVSQVALHVANPYYPPKRFVTPHLMKLLTIATKHKSQPSFEAFETADKIAVFGIRSCDVEGIFHLDRFYLGNAFRDCYYETLRKNLLIINMVCSDIDRDIDTDCFCVCADAGPAAKAHFDLQLMDLHESSGDFLAVAGSEAGEALLARPFFRKANQAHVTRRRAILSEARKHFRVATSWYSAATKFITRGEIKDATWKKIGDQCLECGGCSYVCPTCTCFTVVDQPVGDGVYERVRAWDACALSGFTRMAGGHNPRKAVHDRRNRRFFRKLGHFFIQREFTMACVGCGRCVRVCHGDIGMPKVVEILRRDTLAILKQEQS